MFDVTDDPPSGPRPRGQRYPGHKPLWQHGLDWLDDGINASIPHELDVQRMYCIAKGMYMVGEQPPFDEVKAYIARLWPPWPSTQRQVREIWRTVMRHPHRRYRRIRSLEEPLYVVDLLIEDHGVQPVTEERLAGVAREALEEYLLAAGQIGTRVPQAARRALDGALMAVDGLRRLRLGPAALDEPWPSPDDPRSRPKRPRWW